MRQALSQPITRLALSWLVVLFGLSIPASPVDAQITEIIDATGDGDGNALDGARYIALDGSGNVHVTGCLSDNAFKITPVGVITEIIDAAGDGAGNIFDCPWGIAIDGLGNVFVVGDFSKNVFKITQGGVITEIIDIAGGGIGQPFGTARGIAVDGAGNVYVAGGSTSNAFKITPGGVITEIINSVRDEAGNELRLSHGVALDGAGNVYVTGQASNNAFKITPGGVKTEIIDATGDGVGNDLRQPHDVAVDGAGNVFITGGVNANAFKVTPGGVITEIIDGTGDGTGNTLINARDVVVDAAGNVFVAGFHSENVFKITPGGFITEIIDFSGDGAGNLLDGPFGLALDDAGNVYVAGFHSDNVFKIAGVAAPTNRPPTANAGPDQTVECTEPGGTIVTLDGTGSSDPDDDLLTYTWTGFFPEGGGTTTGATPAITLPFGVSTIALTVEDGNGGTDNDTVDIMVDDTTPPAISVVADPMVLWPPNHKYHRVALYDLVSGVTDACDGDVSVNDGVITWVSSDEPENASGDGNTTDDIVLSGDCQSVDLRAERQGSGNGRVYTVSVAAADASGNRGTASYQVQVPHSKSSTALDDGPAYTVGCGTSKAGPSQHALENAPKDVPNMFVLHGAYPNPFNPQTRLRYDVPEASVTRLVIFDALGRQVRVLVNGQMPAGTHEVVFDAAGLPSGTYLVRLETPAGNFVQTMLLLK